ncbi:lymphatic vessel endothelial hyaluronic receptor 1b isoform X2 [Kryptolebias marmoratus]|uniref:Lymphatic vessel endothelial hyaluronic acid receptor 1-like n=1 Tax=Kryptolebias marmoratus TaxID=37003 RepID=A0A3Q2ZWZ5_KRYMA|nr:lymphatic vessel endothelial hyaluronic receptor 1b isoform X2 [Kryptolebias marmoratus]
MARLCYFRPFLVLFFAALIKFSESSLTKDEPQTQRPTGVFMLVEEIKYTLNFTAARAACLSLNITMATLAQMEEAAEVGLQTCKFGWIAEEIAVVPRAISNIKCGQGKTGVVKWMAPLSKLFGVFCFNASALSGQDEAIKTSTASLTALSRTSSPSVRPTTSPLLTKRPITTPPPKKTTSDSAFTPLVKTTGPTGISSSSSPPPKAIITHSPGSPDHRLTSEPADVSLAFSTPHLTSNCCVSSEPELLQSPSSAKFILGALISLCAALLIMTAAAAVWCGKLSTSCWRRQQKDDMETEMWRNPNCEPEAEEGLDEEEQDPKYSSDLTLCVNPYFKVNSSD